MQSGELTNFPKFGVPSFPKLFFRRAFPISWHRRGQEPLSHFQSSTPVCYSQHAISRIISFLHLYPHLRSFSLHPVYLPTNLWQINPPPNCPLESSSYLCQKSSLVSILAGFSSFHPFIQSISASEEAVPYLHVCSFLFPQLPFTHLQFLCNRGQPSVARNFTPSCVFPGYILHLTQHMFTSFSHLIRSVTATNISAAR